MFLWTSLPAAVIYVNQAATGVNTGESWENAFTDLQSALAIAQPFDEIWIAEGIYKPTNGLDPHETFWIPNGVKIFGGFKGDENFTYQRDFIENQVILSGDIGTIDEFSDNSYHVVSIENSPNQIILDGLKIQNGSAAHFVSNFGGGIKINPIDSNTVILVKVKNCMIGENYAVYGGGIGVNTNLGYVHLTIDSSIFTSNYADASVYFSTNGGAAIGFNADKGIGSLIINNSIFYSNRGFYASGGAIFFSNLEENFSEEADSLLIENCDFISNYSNFHGGAISVNSTQVQNPVLVKNSKFFENKAGDMFEGGDGGAIQALGAIDIINCSFKQNSGRFGGALNLFSYYNKISNCLFFENSSVEEGGAIGSLLVEASFSNCTFFNNFSTSGNIFSIGGYGLLENCILWQDQPTATGCLFFYGGYDLKNCLLKASSCNSMSPFPENINCLGGNIFNQAPRFISPSTGDFSLHRCSPAIDAGTDSLLNTWHIQTDISGMPRTEGPRPDIGAYESPGFRVNLTSLDPGCYGEATGQIEAVVDNGVAPYQINWSNDSTGLSLSKLDPGTYSITLTDSQHCTVINQVEISSPDSLSVWYNVTGVSGPGLNDGSIQIDSIHGGTPPYLYHWNTNDTTASLSGLAVGDYDLSVTDQNGCLKTLSFEVSLVSAVRNLPDQLEAYVSPNPAKYDLPAVLHLSGLSDRPVFIRIIDPSGKTIWFKPIPSGTTAEINTELPTNLPDGIYFISIHSEENNIIRPLKWMVGKD